MKKDNHYLKIAMAAAKKAGRIQKTYFGKIHQVEYKAKNDLVTEVDRLCEQSILKMISHAFPGHDLLAEESPFQDKRSSFKWIIDPLDGTTNYYRGFPCFAVSIGLEVEGVMTVGVVYHPILNEMFHAEKGRGAFLNGKPIQVSRVDRLHQGFLSTGFHYDVHEHVDRYLPYFRQFLVKSFAVRRPGSAAIDLSYLAVGRFDGFWEFKLNPWDVAAASLIVTEAGGKVTGFQGQPFSIYSKEILASNGLIHDEMVQAMKEIKEQGVGY